MSGREGKSERGEKVYGGGGNGGEGAHF